MKLLLVNPNTSAVMTEGMTEAARAVAAPGTVVVGRQPSFGPASIESHYDDVFGAAGVAEQVKLAQSKPGEAFDAVVIACFGDPGVAALRAITQVPVLGLAEVAMRAADALALGAGGGRYAIVTGGAAWGPMLEQLAAELGLAQRLAGVVTLQRSGAELLADPAAAETLLLDACHQALALGGVQAIVIGGAALADLAAPLAPQLPVPLIDNVRVGLLAAWHAACTPHPEPSMETP